MILNNAGSWRTHQIMAKFSVDLETAKRLKAGEDVDVIERADQDTSSDDATEGMETDG